MYSGLIVMPAVAVFAACPRERQRQQRGSGCEQEQEQKQGEWVRIREKSTPAESV